MFWIISFVLLLISCIPDTDSIKATQDEIEGWLPAKLQDSEACYECVLSECSDERITCEQDDDCYDLLECKRETSNTVDFFNCDNKHQKPESARQKYRSYYDCAFVLDSKKSGCRNKCSGGKKFSSCSMDRQKTKETQEIIKLTIRVYQIDDLISPMISPGEHSACVQWIDNNDKTVQNKCDNSFLTSQPSISKIIEDCGKDCRDQDCSYNYTNGFGETTLCLKPSKELDGGYLRIQRGSFDSLTFDDLGPFLYYLGRPINEDQTVTAHLPSKALEIMLSEKWICDGNNSGRLIAIAHDCLGTTADDVEFRFYDSQPFYWDSGDYSFFIDSETEKTGRLGMVSFFNLEASEKATVEARYDIKDGQPQSDVERNIKIENDATTFVVFYLDRNIFSDLQYQ